MKNWMKLEVERNTKRIKEVGDVQTTLDII